MKTRLILINFLSILLGTSYGMVDPILPIFNKNIIGVTYAELGILGMIDTIPYAFIPIFIGFLLYRYNNERLLTIGIILGVASIFLLSMAQSFYDVLILMFVLGVGFAFFWPSCTHIIENMSDKNNGLRNRIIFHGSFTVGMTAGPLLGAIFFSSLDSSYMMIFQLAAIILAAGIIVSIPIHGKGIHVKEMSFSISSLKWIYRFPTVVVIVLYCSACFGIIFSTHPAFLDDNSIGNINIEILFFVFGVSRIITLLNANRLSKRSGLTMILATLAISLGMAVSLLADTVMEFAFAMILLGSGISIFLPLALEIILSRTLKSNQGIIIGTYEAIFGIGWISGAITAGMLSQFYGITSPYPVFFILGIIIVMIGLIRRKSLNITQAKRVV